MQQQQQQPHRGSASATAATANQLAAATHHHRPPARILDQPQPEPLIALDGELITLRLCDADRRPPRSSAPISSHSAPHPAVLSDSGARPSLDLPSLVRPIQSLSLSYTGIFVGSAHAVIDSLRQRTRSRSVRSRRRAVCTAARQGEDTARSCPRCLHSAHAAVSHSAMLDRHPRSHLFVSAVPPSASRRPRLPRLARGRSQSAEQGNHAVPRVAAFPRVHERICSASLGDKAFGHGPL